MSPGPEAWPGYQVRGSAQEGRHTDEAPASHPHLTPLQRPGQAANTPAGLQSLSVGLFLHEVGGK